MTIRLRKMLAFGSWVAACLFIIGGILLCVSMSVMRVGYLIALLAENWHPLEGL